MICTGNQYLHPQRDDIWLKMTKSYVSGCYNSKTKQCNMVRGTINVGYSYRPICCVEWGKIKNKSNLLETGQEKCFVS